MKNSKGITLVALVVTVVILLILAGVSINLVLGENGLIKYAQKAKEATVQESENDNKQIENVTDELSENLTGTKTKNGAPIPEGYYYVGGIRDKGVVISDSSDDENKYADKEDVGKDLSGNQWVWVPVNNSSNLYEKSNEGISILENSNVKTYLYSKGEYRGIPGTNSNREPDISLVYDTDENIKKAGFESLEQMAKTVTNNYEKMINSIEKYNGFYVARYELSENGLKKGKVITGNGWHDSYKLCKNWGKGSQVETDMIWGTQWDAICSWLSSCGYDIWDSSSWGNYINNDAEGAGKPQETGYCESWKANNIYDFAGNFYEVTQETTSYESYNRMIRGGYYSYSGKLKPARERYYNLKPRNVGYEFLTTRVVMYIK